MGCEGWPFHSNAAGTTVVRAAQCQVATVTVGTGGTGSVEIHDCATAGAVAAGNLVAKLDTATAQTFVLECQLFNGLTIVQVGTADVCIVWE